MLIPLIVRLGNLLKSKVDTSLKDTPPHRIILTMLMLFIAYQQLKAPSIAAAIRARHNRSIKQRALDFGFEFAKRIPVVKRYIDEKLDEQFRSDLLKLTAQRETMNLRTEIPELGMTPLQILRDFGIDPKDCDVDFEALAASGEGRDILLNSEDGKDSGSLYAAYTIEFIKLLKETYGRTILDNNLRGKNDRITAMQAEVIHMCLDMFNSQTKCGLLRMSEDPELSNLQKLTHSQYILTDYAFYYYSHSRKQLEIITQDTGKLRAIKAVFPEQESVDEITKDQVKQITAITRHARQYGYGLITHGGTGSILEAMSAYVLHARARGIEHPEIVVPETAHVAFHKAAALTGARLITVPVDPNTGAVSAETMSHYLSPNTAVMVGSAPSFMNGIADPINDLGQLALRTKIPLHVDACLGGFFSAFQSQSNPAMDFRIPGVSSISADLHKYALCPKGTSVCLFSKHSPVLPVYAALNWVGGHYATPGILDGSTSAARIAEIFTTLCYNGRNGYTKITNDILSLRQRIQERIASLPNSNPSIEEGDIEVYSNPQMSLLGFRSRNLNPHLIAYEMNQRGWKPDWLQNPNGFHMCFTQVHTLVENFEDKFIRALSDSVIAAKQYAPGTPVPKQMQNYGAVGDLPTFLQNLVARLFVIARQSFITLVAPWRSNAPSSSSEKRLQFFPPQNPSPDDPSIIRVRFDPSPATSSSGDSW
jgi:glutamate/tyrosine decarboxylase-like PLP-dependent enzyme